MTDAVDSSYTVDELIERLNELRAAGYGDMPVDVGLNVHRDGEFLQSWLDGVEVRKNRYGDIWVSLVIDYEWWGE